MTCNRKLIEELHAIDKETQAMMRRLRRHEWLSAAMVVALVVFAIGICQCF